MLHCYPVDSSLHMKVALPLLKAPYPSLRCSASPTSGPIPTLRITSDREKHGHGEITYAQGAATCEGTDSACPFYMYDAVGGYTP